jgi:dual specificity phosphatase 12
MSKYRISPIEALERIRKVRPMVEPNDGFMQQLDMYARMQMAEDVEKEPIYQRWMYQREVQSSADCGLAPEAGKIRFEDEHVVEGGEGADVEFKCRKCRLVCGGSMMDVILICCRRMLANSNFLIPHRQPPHNEPFPQTLTCAHYFVDPLSWMRPELEKGLLDGRLECPKCKTNVGRYAWQGMKCSCGAWMVPAITITRTKVDEAKTRKGVEGSGIRRGPGVGMPATRAGGRGLL